MNKGEIYYADLGRPFGSEQGGKRLVCIVQNKTGNVYSPTTIICPLTTKIKHSLPVHIKLMNGVPKPSTILCEQIRVVDKNRIDEKNLIYTLTEEEMKELNIALKICLELVDF